MFVACLPEAFLDISGDLDQKKISWKTKSAAPSANLSVREMTVAENIKTFFSSGFVLFRVWPASQIKKKSFKENF